MELISTINDLNIGDFIKISQTNGPIPDRLSFSGKVIQLSKNNNRFELETTDGIVGLSWLMEDMKLEVYKLDQKPKGWGKPIPPKETLVINKTKKDQVFDLVKNNKKKNVKAILTLAKKQIGGDSAILSSYIQLAKAKFK